MKTRNIVFSTLGLLYFFCSLAGILYLYYKLQKLKEMVKDNGGVPKLVENIDTKPQGYTSESLNEPTADSPEKSEPEITGQSVVLGNENQSPGENEDSQNATGQSEDSPTENASEVQGGNPGSSGTKPQITGQSFVLGNENQSPGENQDSQNDTGQSQDSPTENASEKQGGNVESSGTKPQITGQSSVIGNRNESPGENEDSQGTYDFSEDSLDADASEKQNKYPGHPKRTDDESTPSPPADNANSNDQTDATAPKEETPLKEKSGVADSVRVSQNDSSNPKKISENGNEDDSMTAGQSSSDVNPSTTDEESVPQDQPPAAETENPIQPVQGIVPKSGSKNDAQDLESTNNRPNSDPVDPDVEKAELAKASEQPDSTTTNSDGNQKVLNEHQGATDQPQSDGEKAGLAEASEQPDSTTTNLDDNQEVTNEHQVSTDQPQTQVTPDDSHPADLNASTAAQNQKKKDLEEKLAQLYQMCEDPVIAEDPNSKEMIKEFSLKLTALVA